MGLRNNRFTDATVERDVEKWHEENASTDADGNYECGCDGSWGPSGHMVESF